MPHAQAASEDRAEPRTSTLAPCPHARSPHNAFQGGEDPPAPHAPVPAFSSSHSTQRSRHSSDSRLSVMLPRSCQEPPTQLPERPPQAHKGPHSTSTILAVREDATPPWARGTDLGSTGLPAGCSSQGL
ncbi:hypothetical protein P7K49_000083 [Saguinus oedipus]|uniref:Uncharacterized protein n=1 Tax=Saguinus oedipus TaxID=9490 RepID=A0ABQ9WAM9_SAGOE|nr:hypothetical protein P7K49_000083 [Saguinus oedipus]